MCGKMPAPVSAMRPESVNMASLLALGIAPAAPHREKASAAKIRHTCAEGIAAYGVESRLGVPNMTIRARK